MRIAANFKTAPCARCGVAVEPRQGVWLKGHTLCRDALRAALWELYASMDAPYWHGPVPARLAAWAARQNGVDRPTYAELRDLGCR